MCDQLGLRSACANVQSDQNLYLLLEFSMTAKLLTEHNCELLGLKWAAQARLSLHFSKCHIVGNHVLLHNHNHHLYITKMFCKSRPMTYHLIDL